MKFTIVLPSHESHDLSIGCVFIPCLVWMHGKRQILVPHRDDPHYRTGDFQRMLAETYVGETVSDHSNKATLVVHGVGHGTVEYLELLHQDMTDAGFEVALCYQ